jgi:hypothetical protein
MKTTPADKTKDQTSAEADRIDQQIRQWAAEHGIPVPAEGVIPSPVVASYLRNAKTDS